MPSDQPDNSERADSPSPEQFMRLFLRHEARIHGFILALVPNWSDADDLLQETASVLWRRFEEFEAGSNFVAWALTTARFQVMNHRKRFSTKRRLGLRDSGLRDETIDQLADRVISKADQPDVRIDALRDCMGKLPDNDRQIIELRYQHDASTKEVANQTGRSVDAIYKALNRIHRGLLACVRQELGPGHAWNQAWNQARNRAHQAQPKLSPDTHGGGP